MDTPSDQPSANESIFRLPSVPGRGADGAVATPVFRSFWMGGYEGADHVNGQGEPLDMASANGHAQQLAEDYRLAAAHGLRSLRESVGWRLAEPSPGVYDFERMRRAQQAANSHKVQLLWSLMHYGMPGDLSLYDDAMIERFARFAAAVAETLKPLHEQPPVYNLINEMNFVSWAASATKLFNGGPPGLNEAAAAADSTLHSGYEVKRRLVRATLAAIAAVRKVDPRARFLHVEPVVHVTAPREQPELQAQADMVRSYQWQAWDMIAGRQAPELGGHASALDLIGVNHYHSGQWEVSTEQRLWWHLRDPRRRPLGALLEETWQRYRRPMIIAETSHVGEGRVSWFNEVAGEVARARYAGVPVLGLCLYPLIDRPDWENRAHWHHSGLWDVVPDGTTPGPEPLAVEVARHRELQVGYAAALSHWQARLPFEASRHRLKAAA